MIGLLLLAGGGGRLGSCGLRSQECSGKASGLWVGGGGRARGAGAGGRKGQEGRGRGLAGGKPLEALFYLPALNHMKKRTLRLPIFTTETHIHKRTQTQKI